VVEQRFSLSIAAMDVIICSRIFLSTSSCASIYLSLQLRRWPFLSRTACGPVHQYPERLHQSHGGVKSHCLTMFFAKSDVAGISRTIRIQSILPLSEMSNSDTTTPIIQVAGDGPCGIKDGVRNTGWSPFGTSGGVKPKEGPPGLRMANNYFSIPDCVEEILLKWTGVVLYTGLSEVG